MSQHKHRQQRYVLIPRTLIFITNAHDILLIKNASPKKAWPNLYNAIGGHIERRESIQQAALREIHEETGLDHIDQLRLRGTITIDTSESTRGVIIFVFTGSSQTRTVRASTEGALQWVPMSIIPNLPCVHDLPDLLNRISLMTTQDPPFHIHYPTTATHD